MMERPIDGSLSGYLHSLRTLWVWMFAISLCLLLLMAAVFPILEPGTGSYVIGVVNVGVLGVIAVGSLAILLWCRVYDKRNRETF
jgi:hypothetical protein